jgi:hypothetical protein
MMKTSRERQQARTSRLRETAKMFGYPTIDQFCKAIDRGDEMNTNNPHIFKASKVSTNSGWYVDLSGPDAVNPDAYWHFDKLTQARKFWTLVEAGTDPEQAKHEATQ